MHIPQSKSSEECTLGNRKTDSMQRANFAMEIGQVQARRWIQECEVSIIMSRNFTGRVRGCQYVSEILTCGVVNSF